MTKKLNWRLSELPTGSEVAELVKQEVITKEEARQILFSEKEEKLTSEREENYKKQIAFLEDLVKDLSKRQTTVIREPFISTIVGRYRPSWPNTVWCSTGGTTLGAGSTSNMTLSQYTKTLIG